MANVTFTKRTTIINCCRENHSWNRRGWSDLYRKLISEFSLNTWKTVRVKYALGKKCLREAQKAHCSSFNYHRMLRRDLQNVRHSGVDHHYHHQQQHDDDADPYVRVEDVKDWVGSISLRLVQLATNLFPTRRREHWDLLPGHRDCYCNCYWDCFWDCYWDCLWDCFWDCYWNCFWDYYWDLLPGDQDCCD